MPIIADIPVAGPTNYQSKTSIEVVLWEKEFDKTINSDEYSVLLQEYIKDYPSCINEFFSDDFSQGLQFEQTNLNTNNDIQINNTNNLLSYKDIKNVQLLMTSYQKELIRIARKNSVDTGLFDKAFGFMYKQLYHLPFENCAVEISNDNSLKITLKFPNDKQLMVSKTVGNLHIGWNQIIYSYFINRKLIASNVAELEEFSKRFKEYISM